uniref:DNA-binding protein n=1 Tax=OCS116 cluster bacterium TaxID=2030921 RepID=A0A2A4Z6F6_9PROT
MENKTENSSPFLTVEQAAERLHLKPDTLDKWRHNGNGPIFRTHGRRVVYHIDELDAWSKKTSRQSSRKYNLKKNRSKNGGESE